MRFTISTPRRLMATWLLAASAIAVAPAWAQSDTPQDRRAVAEALVKSVSEFAGPERMLKTMQSSVEASLLQQVRAAAHLTPAQQERAAAALSAEMTAAMSDSLKDLMPGMLEVMTKVYVERFSVAELQELLRFHTSAVGIKSMTVMMDDMPRMMQPVMQNMQAQMPRMAQRMQAVQAKLKEEGIDLMPPRR
jgi:hypothetical protein